VEPAAPDILFKELQNQRNDMESDVQDLINESGRGLFQSQVELKLAPWRATWMKLDLMLERQEKMVQLLSEINENLKKFGNK